MKLQALKFCGNSGSGRSEPLQSNLETESLQTFPQTHAGDLPVVFVVRMPDLNHLLVLDRLIIDRKRKHERKALSSLLLGHAPKIPLIQGSYTNWGQLKRSIWKFLEHALQKERNMYIIGTEEGVFKALWERAASVSGQKGLGSGNRGERIFPGQVSSEGDDPSLENLLDLLPSVEVPPKLEETYIGDSPEIKLVRQLILRAAAVGDPVLILGDTGTGKEVVARAIHDYSARRDEKFTTANCANIPSELLESELWGHEKGAFTNAIYKKTGLWKVADKGTLFLDEVGDLAPPHQTKILRALEEGKIQPLGSEKEIAVDTRVIAATNRDLFSLVQSGQFREDLYYRLRGILIRTPPLRNHPEDIPLLAQNCWDKITGDKERVLQKEILEELESHFWPGNVRQLKWILRSLYALFGKENLGKRHIRAVLQLEGQQPAFPQGKTLMLDDRIYRIECLRHLRRVDEVIRACKVTVQPVIDDRESDPVTIQSIRMAIRFRRDELEVLCLDPRFFFKESIFSTAYRLKGKLFYFQSLLESDLEKGLEYWNKEAAKEIKAATTVISEGIEELFKNM